MDCFSKIFFIQTLSRYIQNRFILKGMMIHTVEPKNPVDMLNLRPRFGKSQF